MRLPPASLLALTSSADLPAATVPWYSIESQVSSAADRMGEGV